MIKETIDLKKTLKEAFDNELITESGCCNRIPHLYEDYKMTFNEMRQIFRDVFSGKTVLTEKTDGLDILVTYKDGCFCFAKNKGTIMNPMNLSKLEECFTGEGNLLREAYVNSAKDLSRALNSIEVANLERLFENGRNFASMKIIYPPCSNVMDYGKRCVLQLNGLQMYDQNGNLISEDKEGSDWLFNCLKNHKALKQEMFEIEEPRILRMKDSVSANKALEDLMEDFNEMIDGYSTRCTIKDYANERLRRYIINVCNRNDIDVERDCPFVRELADRIGNFSGRRPTKADICTFAKRDGVDVRSDNYKAVMEDLDLKREAINEEVMRPIENLVMKAGVYLLKNLRGYMASDPNKCSQKISERLETIINEVESDNSKMTPEKMKIFKKHMGKLENWKDKICPSSGIIFKHGNKTYKVLGAFGNIRQILKIFGEK